jgi:phage tail protein X
MMQYLTKQNDILDDIVFRYYGDTTGGIVEQVLEANQGIAERGPLLPQGVTVNLPDRPPSKTAGLKRLWS